MQYEIKGLKCDKPGCNFIDMSIEFKDYEKHINHPCPECGSSLLTQEDYETTKLIASQVELMKQMGLVSNQPVKEGEGLEVKIELDGTGVPKFSIEEL